MRGLLWKVYFATAAFSVLPALPAMAEEVTLQLDGPYYGGHVPYVVGVQKGIYSQHGLEVKVSAGQGSLTIVQLLANNKVDFGTPDFGVLVKARSQGLPVTAIVGGLQKTPYLIVTRKSAGVSKPADLESLRFGFVSSESTSRIFPLFAKKAGIDLAKVMANATTVSDYGVRNALFQNGNIDAAFAYVTSKPSYEQQCKCELNAIAMADYGIRVMANGLATSDSKIETQTDLVKRFAAATQEALEYAAAHQDEAVDLFFKFVGYTSLTRETVVQQFAAMVSVLRTDATRNMAIGCMARDDWEAMIEQLHETDQISAMLDPSKMFTNKFLRGCS